jgi:hypothetical protein
VRKMQALHAPRNVGLQDRTLIQLISAREEEPAEPTFTQVAVNLGEAIVDQKREADANIQCQKVIDILARPNSDRALGSSPLSR